MDLEEQDSDCGDQMSEHSDEMSWHDDEPTDKYVSVPADPMGSQRVLDLGLQSYSLAANARHFNNNAKT